MPTVGEQIRSARKAKGLTQEALASILNMSRQGISHWEAGRTSPDASMLLKLSQVLEYSFEAEASFADLASPAPSLQPADTPIQPEVDKKPKRRMKPLLIEVTAVVVLALLVTGIIVKRNIQANASSVVCLEILETPLYLRNDPDLHMGRGWRYTFSIRNDSDIPFKPTRIIALFYSGERILNKVYVTYEEMRPWMDSPKLLRLDTPLHWYFSYSADNIEEPTSVEMILQGTDDNGHELTFSITEPLLHYTEKPLMPLNTSGFFVACIEQERKKRQMLQLRA